MGASETKLPTQLNGYQIAGITAACLTLANISENILETGDVKITTFKWFNVLAEELGIVPEELRTMVRARMVEPCAFLWMTNGVRNTWNIAPLDAQAIEATSEMGMEALE